MLKVSHKIYICSRKLCMHNILHTILLHFLMHAPISECAPRLEIILYIGAPAVFYYFSKHSFLPIGACTKKRSNKAWCKSAVLNFK